MSKDTSGSAFPLAHDGALHLERGLTKREYFAAMAMQGQSISDWDSIQFDVLAKLCCKAADALIAELAK